MQYSLKIWILTVPRQRARNDTKSKTFSTLWSTSSPSGKKLPSNPRKNSDLDLLCSSYTTSPFYKMATPGKQPPGQQRQKRQFIFFWAYYLYVVKVVQKSPKVKKQTTGSRGSWPLLSCMVGAMPLHHQPPHSGKNEPIFSILIIPAILEFYYMTFTCLGHSIVLYLENLHMSKLYLIHS